MASTLSTPISTQSSSSVPSNESNRAKTDPAWKYCTQIKTNGKLELKCMFCNKSFKGGGINRLKYHIAGLPGGGCVPCIKAKDEARHELTKSIQEFDDTKKQTAAKISRDRSFREEEENDDVGGFLPSKKICISGSGSSANDNSSNPLSPSFMPRTTSGSQPTIRSVMQGQAMKDAVDLSVAKWFYDAAVPFNGVTSVLFQPMLDSIASYGVGYKAPTIHALRGKLLKTSVQQLQDELLKHRATWKETGCSLMADGWTDQNNRSLINFLVYSTKGTFFLNSVDASSASKTASILFALFKEAILFIGAENIVQVVTDNGANYKAAGKLIMHAFPTISWSPCAAHCLNLMFTDIGKIDRVARAVQQASNITKYIYNHCFVLYLMRKFTENKNILRPAPTRFATNFVALQSILTHKDHLVAMVSSIEWKRSTFAKDRKGKTFVDNVFDPSFWKECAFIVSITEPLVCVLRLADGDDRPAMGYLYASIHNAREQMIKRFTRSKKELKPFLDIVDDRWDRQLHKNLHSAGFWFNPEYHYNVEQMKKHASCNSCILDVIENYSKGNPDLTEELTKEMKFYKNAEGDFGRSSAIKNRVKMLPDEWWSTYGGMTPKLQKLAIRVLSQTCSSSGCERNWSVFQHIHSKKRNRLEHQRLNDLVFVHYNLRLAQRREAKGRNYDPINIQESDNCEWVLEDEPLELTVEEVNALYEEDLIINPISQENEELEEEVDLVDNEAEIEPVDLVNVIQPCYTTMESMAREHGIEILNYDPTMSLQDEEEARAAAEEESPWAVNLD